MGFQPQLQVSMNIIDEGIPLLLSLADMDHIGLFYNNLQDRLIHPASGQFVKVTRFHDRLFLTRNPITSCLFTELELRRLQRRFGHPRPDELYNLLKPSELPDVASKTRQFLEKITRRCKPCQEHAPAPRRFKLTLREEKEFNHTVFVDIFYIEKKAILHVVDESTRYRVA